MFILYDLNMKQIPFPDGIVPLDIFVSSIAKERQTETIPGRVGVADYGSEYRERSVDLSLMIKSYNAMFYRTQRNRLYELFSEHDVFYIAESHLPSRVLKVAVDDSYIPERISGNAYASTAEITCRTLDSVFWESIYTTKELHDTGYDAVVAKYGLVDNIDVSQTQYEFEPNESTEDLSTLNWTQGNISSSTGLNADNSVNIRSAGYIHVNRGYHYHFKDLGDNPDVGYLWVFHYNSDDSFIDFETSQLNDDRKSLRFRAQGDKVRFLIYYTTGNPLSPDDIGGNIKPYIYKPTPVTSFSVWNAGNVTVEPESMRLIIRLNYAYGANGVSIKNLTTGETFVLNTEVNGSHVVLDGMNIYRGSLNDLRNSNRQRISLLPGKNNFEIVADSFDFARIDFKYYYK